MRCVASWPVLLKWKVFFFFMLYDAEVDMIV
jgi:hypothetical protein